VEARRAEKYQTESPALNVTRRCGRSCRCCGSGGGSGAADALARFVRVPLFVPNSSYHLSTSAWREGVTPAARRARAARSSAELQLVSYFTTAREERGGGKGLRSQGRM
jgi:hypothetical protein